MGCVIWFLAPSVWSAWAPGSARPTLPYVGSGRAPRSCRVRRVLCGVGFGLMARLLDGKKLEDFAAQMRERHPNEPCSGARTGAAHRIEDSSKSGMIAAWAFTIFWNAIATVGRPCPPPGLATHEPNCCWC